ncbi:hypothetical protein [Elizabethkingia anophelis]|uniref:hypothetical protein n=1 Tax=Elizabethkingia anophelis TaxID=1117645 RepID=UPI0007518110|nr:hypothetical protein [Elizabethkingia anophelis]AQW91295.1 hypothetical protein BBD28_11800 [Elizabethkingia anophelis]KUY14161.1 hypothetical protein ATB94_09180 [Elizabethkingia anophelis]
MTSKEKANELIEKFLPKMYCYMGSGMLTNTYDEGVAKGNAVECAIICANQTLSELESAGITDIFWKEVKSELEKMKRWS